MPEQRTKRRSVFIAGIVLTLASLFAIPIPGSVPLGWVAMADFEILRGPAGNRFYSWLLVSSPVVFAIGALLLVVGGSLLSAALSLAIACVGLSACATPFIDPKVSAIVGFLTSSVGVALSITGLRMYASRRARASHSIALAANVGVLALAVYLGTVGFGGHLIGVLEHRHPAALTAISSAPLLGFLVLLGTSIWFARKSAD